MSEGEIHRESTDNLAPAWKPGESGNPNGRPKGQRNRATIAREVANAILNIPDQTLQQLRQLYPDMPEKAEAEALMVWRQAMNAIIEGDVRSYQAFMDSLYGKPHQSVEHSGEQIQKIILVEQQDSDTPQEKDE